MNSEHYDILHACLTKCLRADPGEIDPSANLLDSGILDSLDSMQFIFEVEKTSGKRLGVDDDLTADKFTFATLSEILSSVKLFNPCHCS